MRRSSINSSTSLKSLTSINSSGTKLFNVSNKDFQKYIASMEDDIMKVNNDYYYLTNKFDRKLTNIINRFDGRTNSLFIDIRNRESEYRKINMKIENIIKDLNECKKNTCICINKSNYMVISFDNIKDIDSIYINILIYLYIYTSFTIVIVIIINYCI
jgi:hypothetical protein